MPYSYIIHVLDTYRSVYLLFPVSRSIHTLYSSCSIRIQRGEFIAVQSIHVVAKCDCFCEYTL